MSNEETLRVLNKALAIQSALAASALVWAAAGVVVGISILREAPPPRIAVIAVWGALAIVVHIVNRVRFWLLTRKHPELEPL